MLLIALGVAFGIRFGLADSDSWVRSLWQRYREHLDREFRFQLWRTPAKHFAIGHGTAIVLILLAAAWGFPLPFAALTAVVVVFMPFLYLTSQHAQRVAQLEELLDQWMLLIANGLKSSPSIGEAIESSGKLIRKPFADEVDLVIKEMRLGTPVDQAILNMSKRINSPVVSGALATIIIGRQTGGDLPAILERAAAALREMQRLEGVVRTKTAENKSQGTVMAAMPFVLIGILHMMDRTWLTPLFNSTTGYLVLTVAIMFWLGGVLWARKILQVDI